MRLTDTVKLDCVLGTLVWSIVIDRLQPLTGVGVGVDVGVAVGVGVRVAVGVAVGVGVGVGRGGVGVGVAAGVAVAVGVGVGVPPGSLKAYTLLLAAKYIRPRATMPAFHLTVLAISSFVPPPAYTIAPVSPFDACKRWSPLPEPTTHTIALLVPSVVVTQGDPCPL